MALLQLASQEYKYDIDLAEVAKIWRAGCIIRAALLSDVRNAFSRNPGLVNLMLDDSFANALASGQQALREVVQTAVAAGIPVPALGSSLAYYDAYRSARLPANLTQGQRDFFGAHTYRRIDRDGVFHTDWTHA
jgi:6-phosphogluconate dehydrogenase